MEIYNHVTLHLDFLKTCIFLLLFSTKFSLITSQQTFANTTFNFTKFTSNMPDIILEGDAIIGTLDEVIKLTKSFSDLTEEDSVGRAVYAKPFHLWDKTTNHLADVRAHFIFSIDNPERANISTGSGMTFFLTPNSSQIPRTSFSKGSDLGISTGQSSSDRFIAIEFDTYFSSDQIDPVSGAEHIGIDINSTDSVAIVECSTNFSTWNKVEVWVDYNSSTHNLSVFAANSGLGTLSCTTFYIIDLRKILTEWVSFGFSASTSQLAFEEHKILSWDFVSSLPLETIVANQTLPAEKIPEGRKKSRTILILIIGIGGSLILLAVGLVCFVYFKMKNSRAQQKEGNTTTEYINDEFENQAAGPRSYSYDELVTATNNFAGDRILGKGGFGTVYLGFWNDRRKCIAVKMVTSESEQGIKAYTSEVTTISRLRHRNLVQLLGWCRRKRDLFIVYEFMPNNSLDFHLFNNTGLLTWEKRYGIAVGLASGIRYLHEECDQCVLHRDIKSSNVLLDSNFNAKLGDFGLARLVEHGHDSETTHLIGTAGYVSPEYLQSSKATKESDVYSFGVVVLELASGKPALRKPDYGGTPKATLVEWIWEHYRRGNIFDAVDPLLNQNYVTEEVERLIIVGLACAHPSHSHRLSIKDAFDVLNAKTPLPILPLEMPFLIYAPYNTPFSIGSSSNVGSSSANTKSSSITSWST